MTTQTHILEISRTEERIGEYDTVIDVQEEEGHMVWASAESEGNLCSEK